MKNVIFVLFVVFLALVVIDGQSFDSSYSNSLTDAESRAELQKTINAYKIIIQDSSLDLEKYEKAMDKFVSENQNLVSENNKKMLDNYAFWFGIYSLPHIDYGVEYKTIANNLDPLEKFKSFSYKIIDTTKINNAAKEEMNKQNLDKDQILSILKPSMVFGSVILIREDFIKKHLKSTDETLMGVFVHEVSHDPADSLKRVIVLSWLNNKTITKDQAALIRIRQEIAADLKAQNYLVSIGKPKLLPKVLRDIAELEGSSKVVMELRAQVLEESIKQNLVALK